MEFNTDIEDHIRETATIGGDLSGMAMIAYSLLQVATVIGGVSRGLGSVASKLDTRNSIERQKMARM